MLYLCDLLQSELEEAFKELGEKPYRARQLVQWVYKKRETDLEKMTDLPEELREKLRALPIKTTSLKLVHKKDSGEHKATKYLFELEDKNLIETVLLKVPSRKTLCISTQVGCPIDCQFCASGKEGVIRNLHVHEIVEQVLAVNCDLYPDDQIQNIVVMGMGEPFLNYERMMKALRILNAHWGMQIGARHITVSTSGILPGIKRFAKEPESFQLAVSLHAAIDAKRTAIMPINEKYPLADLKESLKGYLNHKNKYITFEYILLAGVNDQPEDVLALTAFVQDLPAKINLIPYNPVEGAPFKTPSVESQRSFYQSLMDKNIFSTLRETKGSDIDAACGQLRLRKKPVSVDIEKVL